MIVLERTVIMSNRVTSPVFAKLKPTALMQHTGHQMKVALFTGDKATSEHPGQYWEIPYIRIHT